MPDNNGRVTTTSLGFPRIGPDRELKRALEAHWAGRIDQAALLEAAREIRRMRWSAQSDAGIDIFPSGDFSLYDHVLDTALMVGAVPARFRRLELESELDLTFAMARGAEGPGGEVAPLDMTKWFDTNYHYLVPELEPEQTFALSSTRVVDEFNEARAAGFETRPVLLGPLTFLCLSKIPGSSRSPLRLLDELIPVYQELLRQLGAAGAGWVQLDEPCLAQDAPVSLLEGLERAYLQLRQAAPGLKILLASYFGGLGPNLESVVGLPVDAVHLDLARGPEDLERALSAAPESLSLSLGHVDGRNVWRMDPDPAVAGIARATSKLGPSRVMIAPSCSLMHLPWTTRDEASALDPELLSWLAFAQEKLEEVALLARAASGADVRSELEAARASIEARRTSPRRHRPEVAGRLGQVSPADRRQGQTEDQRREFARSLGWPLIPTTTIGSFPQRSELRQARARLRRGELDRGGYEEVIRQEITKVVRFQEEAGLDLLVHGEPERNDMVEYFAEQLEGMVTTARGWVQSYGSRCAKPPIVLGDVWRRSPMTVAWTTFTQGLTDRPVKGVITGPVTILQWSFPREDLDRATSCKQIALALRDEVADLVAAGIRVVQIDEPALREALPLRRADHAAYLRWAVDSFRLAAGGAPSSAQVHTHMCYAEFSDIMEGIEEMEADALYIEAARSGMTLLRSLADSGYPGPVGPGLYDIHSPLVPSVEEMAERLRAAARVIPVERLWANPDCGLKTRTWPEVDPSLRHMVAAARQVAGELEPASAGVR